MPVPGVLVHFPFLFSQLPLGWIPMVLQDRQTLGSDLVGPPREVKGYLSCQDLGYFSHSIHPLAEVEVQDRAACPEVLWAP